MPRRQGYVETVTTESHPGTEIGQSAGTWGYSGSYNESDEYVVRVPPRLPPPPVHVYPSQSSSSPWEHSQASSARCTPLFREQRMTQTVSDQSSYSNQKDNVQVERISSKGKEMMDRHSMKERGIVIQPNLSDPLVSVTNYKWFRVYMLFLFYTKSTRLLFYSSLAIQAFNPGKRIWDSHVFLYHVLAPAQ